MIYVGPFGMAEPPFLLFRGDGVVVIACSSPFSGYRDPATRAPLGRFRAVAVPAPADDVIDAARQLVGFDAGALGRLAPAGGHGYGATVDVAAAAAVRAMREIGNGKQR